MADLLAGFAQGGAQGAFGMLGDLFGSQVMSKTDRAKLLQNQQQFQEQMHMRRGIWNLLGLGSFGEGGQFNFNSGGLNNLLGRFKGFGDASRARVNQQFTNASNSALARLRAGGVVGSNLPGAVSQGFERERGMALADVDEQVQGRQLQMIQSLMGGLA